jgi:glutamate dehydrogenase
MTSAERSRQQILNKLHAYIRKHVAPTKVEILQEFCKRYYAMVSYEDLAERSIEDLFGAMQSHWEFLFQRAPGVAKVRVFNPDKIQDGWSSTHTVIQLSHDDMPFLVDSIRLEINRHGFLVHHIVHLGGLRVKRNANHRVNQILPRDKNMPGSLMEAPIYLEIDRQTDPNVLKALQASLIQVLDDASVAVSDWHIMLEQLESALVDLEQAPPPLDPAEVTETKAFLRWLKDNFILFGCRDYRLIQRRGEKILQAVQGSGFGVLRDSSEKHLRYLSEMPPEAQKLALSSTILIIAKTNTKSTIHRGGYTDFVAVKRFDKEGNLLGERRFIGLYTSSAYNSNPKHIPFLRLKVAKVIQSSNLSTRSHAGKKLLNILETLPRDDLFQASAKELLNLSMGIFHLQDRQRIRLFMRKDSYGRFYSCLVYVPRESFNTELSRHMQDILKEMLNGEEVSFSTLFTDSMLARIHYMVRVPRDLHFRIDARGIEKRLVEVGMSWRHELYQALVNYFGEAEGCVYFNRYRNAFLASYRESFSPKVAVFDIEQVEALSDTNRLNMNFFKPLDRDDTIYRFKVYQRDHTIPLSDALPILENMGFRVIGERPHRIDLSNGKSAWINDFDLVYQLDKAFDVEVVKDTFQAAFAAVWLDVAENDGFNRLVLQADISWHMVRVFRVYARYLSLTNFTLSSIYIAETLTRYADITRELAAYFVGMFDPENALSQEKLKTIERRIIHMLETVVSLDEDKILHRYLDVMKATVRTNFFQRTPEGACQEFLSVKLQPAKIPDIPLPHPMYEIFVYSPRFEGVHLRGAKVARGGLRWSDRREDFRTEILGLMKAQQVKNAVIVPLGAKGGFLTKQMPQHADRDQILAEGIACYKLFIQGLLDITDNIVDGKIVPPKSVKRLDEDDPYLVVAADKGTATFSDIANDIAVENQFWLGDAFASGGSTGYDHKKMGITARGAWESVKRHFREMGVDTQTTDFTAVGIGDMSGDVFGNGMLLSEHIRLVAAFNHMHIFIDPNPDASVSFKERQRLFNLPRSAWTDYQAELMSKGGGVFDRASKSIHLTPEMKKVLGVRKESVTPNELISAILQMDVDLLWNGGIGTYVKSSSETHSDVGDRSNDGLRISANTLRCKVVGEGGNLGFTQLARVEFALAGGRIYTDAIDNSAGVDCSDHEVNIKILLSQVQNEGELSEKQRNKLLADMTDEIAKLVLIDNYRQTQSISLNAIRAKEGVEIYERFIDALEQNGRIDRQLEYLPDEKAILERKARGVGLTRPELAVLHAYSKIWIKEKLLESDVPEDPYLSQMLGDEFPTPLRKKYSSFMPAHSLSREIIATQLSNVLVNQMGVTFIQRLESETGACAENIVRAYAIARIIFDNERLWTEIEALDLVIDAKVQFALFRRVNRLIRRATRWLLRNRSENIDIEALVADFKAPMQQFQKSIFSWLPESEKQQYQLIIDDYTAKKVPVALAEEVALSSVLFSGLDIIEAASIGHYRLENVSKAYFCLGSKLEFGWFRDQILSLKPDDNWDALARSIFREDLDYLQRMLTISILKSGKRSGSTEQKIEKWIEMHQDGMKRWFARVADMRACSTVHPVMMSVGLRDLLDLTRSGHRLVVLN